MIRKFFLLTVSVLIYIAGISQNIPDSLKSKPKVKITLENSIIKSGLLVYDDEIEIKIWSEDFGYLKIQKIQIQKIEYLPEETTKIKGEGEYDYAHHYAFSNSSFLPKKGELYIRTPYFVNGCLDYGIASDLTIGVGAFYFVAMNTNLRYNIKFSENTRLCLSAGFYYSYLGIINNNKGTLASGRATFTIGSPTRNITFGASYLTNFNRFEIGYASVSGITPISYRTSLVADLFIAPDLRPLQADINYMALGFLGIRIKTKKGNRLDVGFASLIFESVIYTWYTNSSRIITYFIPLPFGQLSFKL